jgi:hypothetical protein
MALSILKPKGVEAKKASLISSDALAKYGSY